VGLLHCAQQSPDVLSGGEQQRVAIARAIVRDPWLLIADEPTGNLDHRMAQDVFALFERTNRRGTTVVIVTHATEVLEQAPSSRRILHLEHGQIVESRDKTPSPMGLFPAAPDDFAKKR
jgi:cell division transport system ATP-binding protein